MNISTKNLLFLLATAPMGLGACVSIDLDDGDSGNGDSTTGNGDGDGDDAASTGNGDGDGDPSTGDGDGDPSTGDGDGDGDGDPSTGDGDGDGDPNAACTVYADLVSVCYGPSTGTAAYDACLQALADYASLGVECELAYEAYLVCLSLLTCEEFADPGTCSEEAAEAQLVCG